MKQLLINCLQTSPQSPDIILSLNCSICVFNIFAQKGPTEKGRVLQFYSALCCLALSSGSDAVDDKLGYWYLLSLILLGERSAQFIFISAYVLPVVEGVPIPQCPFACPSLFSFLSAQHTKKLIFLFFCSLLIEFFFHAEKIPNWKDNSSVISLHRL